MNMKVYTKKGDTGQTGLLLGGRVSKSDARCEAYGAADESVSAMGLARALCNDKRVKEIILKVQREMFTVSAELATDPAHYRTLKTKYSVVTEKMVTDLERLIDEIDSQIELPPEFIVPGTSSGSGALDLSRSLVRTTERRVVSLNEQHPLPNLRVLKYINRLSDLLFMLARLEDRENPLELANG